MTSQVLGINCF